MTAIMGLDPGGTTGVTICSFPQEALTRSIDPFAFMSWKMFHLGPDPHHTQFAEQLVAFDVFHPQSQGPRMIVCESFEYRNQSRPGLVLVSLEYIGIAKLYSGSHNVPLKMQTAAMAKGLVTDENIRRLGLWKSGMKHAMDATRHVLYYIISQQDDWKAARLSVLKRGWKAPERG